MEKILENINKLFTQKVTFSCLVAGLFIKEMIQRRWDEMKFKKEETKNMADLNESILVKDKNDLIEEIQLDIISIELNSKNDKSETQLLTIKEDKIEIKEKSEIKLHETLPMSTLIEHRHIPEGEPEINKPISCQLNKNITAEKYGMYTKSCEVEKIKQEKILQVNLKGITKSMNMKKNTNNKVTIKKHYEIYKNIKMSQEIELQSTNRVEKNNSDCSFDKFKSGDGENTIHSLKEKSSLHELVYTDSFKCNTTKTRNKSLHKQKARMTKFFFKNQLSPIAEHNEDIFIRDAKKTNTNGLTKNQETLLSENLTQNAVTPSQKEKENNLYTIIKEENLLTNKSYYNISGEISDNIESEVTDRIIIEKTPENRTTSEHNLTEVSSSIKITEDDVDLLYHNLKMEKYLTDEIKFLKSKIYSEIIDESQTENEKEDKISKPKGISTNNNEVSHLVKISTKNEEFNKEKLETEMKLKSNQATVNTIEHNLENIKDGDFELGNENIIKKLEDDNEVLKLHLSSTEDSDNSLDETGVLKDDEKQQNMKRSCQKRKKTLKKIQEKRRWVWTEDVQDKEISTVIP